MSDLDMTEPQIDEPQIDDPQKDDPLVIAGRTFRSRLFLGTGKFPSIASLRDAIRSSGTEMVTVALRRVDLSGRGDDNILEIGRAHV